MKVRYYGFLGPACRVPLEEVQTHILRRMALPWQHQRPSRSRARCCAVGSVAENSNFFLNSTNRQLFRLILSPKDKPEIRVRTG